jgi:hypothetical protein
MTDWMAQLSGSRLAVMIIFGGLAVLTVGGLELFRTWLGRAPREERGGGGERVAALIAIVYLVLAALGGGGMAANGKNFLDLAFVLFGIVGLVIVAAMMWSYRHGLPLGDTEEEARRIAARDL